MKKFFNKKVLVAAVIALTGMYGVNSYITNAAKEQSTVVASNFNKVTNATKEQSTVVANNFKKVSSQGITLNDNDIQSYVNNTLKNNYGKINDNLSNEFKKQDKSKPKIDPNDKQQLEEIAENMKKMLSEQESLNVKTENLAYGGSGKVADPNDVWKFTRSIITPEGIDTNDAILTTYKNAGKEFYDMEVTVVADALEKWNEKGELCRQTLLGDVHEDLKVKIFDTKDQKLLPTTKKAINCLNDDGKNCFRFSLTSDELDVHDDGVGRDGYSYVLLFFDSNDKYIGGGFQYLSVVASDYNVDEFKVESMDGSKLRDYVFICSGLAEKEEDKKHIKTIILLPGKVGFERADEGLSSIFKSDINMKKPMRVDFIDNSTGELVLSKKTTITEFSTQKVEIDDRVDKIEFNKSYTLKFYNSNGKQIGCKKVANLNGLTSLRVKRNK